MSFRQSKSLKHVPLPIVGHTLVDVHTEPAVTLVFAKPDGLQSHLRLEFQVLLSRADGSTEAITASGPGHSYDPAVACEQISFLVDKAVTQAFAHSDGRLEITWEEGTTLRVHPDDYEAWTFQQPAPGSRKPYHYANLIIITGYGGGLM